MCTDRLTQPDAAGFRCCTSLAVLSGVIATVVAFVVGVPANADAQPPASRVHLVLQPQRVLRVVISQRTFIRQSGQTVTGTLLEPIYAYDRIVLPQGTPVRIRIVELKSPPVQNRVLAVAGGDLSSHPQATVIFDGATAADGRRIALHATVTRIGNLVRHRAPDHAGDGEEAGARGVTGKVRQQVKEQERELHDMMTAPGKMQRVKDGLLRRLPYHRPFWSAGTVFDGSLDEPVDFGEADEVAPLDGLSQPPPNTVLRARLTTRLDSSLSMRGTPVTASLTVPVFSADHRLLLPEGTVLSGEVTQARPARHFRHNGQLRFLIVSVARRSNSPQTLLASLHAVDATSTDSLEIDSEGGAAMTNPKTRFVAPALSVLSLVGSVNQHTEGADEPGDVTTLQNNTGAQTTGGFIGFGLIGAAIGWVSRPAAIAFSAVATARTVYTSFIAKGRDVVFPPNTAIELALAPGPPTKRR